MKQKLSPRELSVYTGGSKCLRCQPRIWQCSISYQVSTDSQWQQRKQFLETSGFLSNRIWEKPNSPLLQSQCQMPVACNTWQVKLVRGIIDALKNLPNRALCNILWESTSRVCVLTHAETCLDWRCSSQAGHGKNAALAFHQRLLYAKQLLTQCFLLPSLLKESHLLLVPPVFYWQTNVHRQL